MTHHPAMAAILTALVSYDAAGQVSFELATIDEPGNPTDTNGLGAVDSDFRIGRFEVTNTQYVVSLNAVAAADPNGLYAELMSDSDRGGIIRLGAPGSHSYELKRHFDNKPVNAVDWPDAARFCNWLHNGQPTGSQGPDTTEDGVYDMSEPIGQITRRPDATWFIPTHDEWYKAAYF